MLQSKEVVVYQQAQPSYSDFPPYHPPQAYPEYRFPTFLDTSNLVYGSIRSSLYLLGLDHRHFGTASWNPFRDLIKPGETVLLKPNMIAHSNEVDDEWQSVITHGSVVRTIIDYVYIALQGHGKIVIADAPRQIQTLY